MNVVYLNDDEYKAMLAERKAKAGPDRSKRIRSLVVGVLLVGPA